MAIESSVVYKQCIYIYIWSLFIVLYYSAQPRASRVSGVPGMAIAMPQATKHDKELRAALPAHGHTSKVSLEKSATKSQPPDLPHVQATGFELLSWVCGSSPAPTTLTLTCRHCFRKKKLKHPKVRGQSTTNQLTSGKRVNGHPGALPSPHGLKGHK